MNIADRFLNVLILTNDDPDLRAELVSLFHCWHTSLLPAEFYLFPDGSVVFISNLPPTQGEAEALSSGRELVEFLQYWAEQVNPQILPQLKAALPQ